MDIVETVFATTKIALCLFIGLKSTREDEVPLMSHLKKSYR